MLHKEKQRTQNNDEACGSYGGLSTDDAKKRFSLEQATKVQRVSRGIALPFHDLGA